eukprot:TRINITY_DN14539_c0_g1_i1.p1 TRINITY_DN14539_c0_g1~~TRINITY_DN14539_c0_g1_i1.p1  ORF type:complete len:233 (+),score=48.42 TRINITY_DN14539_c0_g1_i1:95-793(+)
MGAACSSPGTIGNPSATRAVQIYGMPISGNVIPPVLFAMDKQCGSFVMKNMMAGELKTPEMLAVNPWGQMPSMCDGDFALAESNAILRYMANTYAPEAYGGMDSKKRGIIDWALDWCSTNFSKNYADIWYPVAGFGPAPSDQNAANAAATENLNKFAAQFLAKGKFIGDSDTLSIADYKCATLFWYLDHKTVKAKTGFELPPRIKTYVQDFLAACPSKAFLDAGSGFMDSKA